MLTWYSPRPAEPTSSQTPFPQTELWWVQSSLQLSRVSPTLNQPVNFPETRWEVGRGVQKLVTRPDTLTRGSSRQEMSRPSEAKPLEYRRREEHNRKPWGPHQERKRRAARGRLHVGSTPPRRHRSRPGRSCTLREGRTPRCRVWPWSLPSRARTARTPATAAGTRPAGGSTGGGDGSTRTPWQEEKVTLVMRKSNTTRNRPLDKMEGGGCSRRWVATPWLTAATEEEGLLHGDAEEMVFPVQPSCRSVEVCLIAVRGTSHRTKQIAMALHPLAYIVILRTTTGSAVTGSGVADGATGWTKSPKTGKEGFEMRKRPYNIFLVSAWLQLRWAINLAGSPNFEGGGGGGESFDIAANLWNPTSTCATGQLSCPCAGGSARKGVRVVRPVRGSGWFGPYGGQGGLRLFAHLFFKSGAAKTVSHGLR